MNKTFFSEFFNVSKKLMKEYGALDISLISDTPAFIDPFLLYSSSKADYQKVHRNIIEYIKFLCLRAEEAKNNVELKEKYYHFKEPKQNWLGYTAYGNSGTGLKKEFAEELCINACNYINNFGKETITNSSHMEKLCLFNDGHGLDNISDFTTCLIMPFLLEYTEKFSKDFLDNIRCKEFYIERAYFDFEEEEWKGKSYTLPAFNNDYVILVPQDILVKDENFISRNNFVEELKNLRINIDNREIRERVNEYITEIINGEFTAKEFNNKINDLIKRYPQLIDYYIKSKEDNSTEAIKSNKEFVKELNLLFDVNCNAIIDLLKDKTDFYDFKDIDNPSIIIKRINALKYVIEELGASEYLYINNKTIDSNLIDLLFKRIWYAGKPKESDKRYVNYVLEFKKAFNSPIENNIQNRYLNNNKKDKIRFLCYVYFSEREQSILEHYINKYRLANNKNFTIINAIRNNV